MSYVIGSAACAASAAYVIIIIIIIIIPSKENPTIDFLFHIQF